MSGERPTRCPCNRCDQDEALRAMHLRWIDMISLFNERQTRLYVAEKALEMGRGGVVAMARISGLAERTIRRGIQELKSGEIATVQSRVRRSGAGRKRVEADDSGLLDSVQALMRSTTANDPAPLLSWSCRSLTSLTEMLAQQGHRVSPNTVARILSELGYCRQAAVKPRRGRRCDPPAQFAFIHQLAKERLQAGHPVLDVQLRKRMAGTSSSRRSRLAQQASSSHPPAAAHRTPSSPGKQTADEGQLSEVELTRDSAEVAVAGIERWWRWLRDELPAAADQLMILIRPVGKSRWNQVWQQELKRFVSDYQVAVTVCHYPVGIYRWHGIDHRLVSTVSLHRAGRPRVQWEATVRGLAPPDSRRTVTPLLRRDYYAAAIPCSSKPDIVQLIPHTTHPDWNYTLGADG